MSLQCVGPGIYAIDSDYIRPQLDAVHLLVDDGEVAFVDTGVQSSVPHILAALKVLGHAPDAVRYVFLTHIHLDHAGAASVLMAHFPKATLVVHPRGARHMADPSRLIAGSVAVYGETEFNRLYGSIGPIDPARIHASTDGERLMLGRRTMALLHTPGHAKHHHSIVDLDGDGVFTGDVFGLSYRAFDVEGRPFVFPSTSPVGFDPVAAHASIDRIATCGATVAYLTHYSRVGELPRLAADLHADIDAFVALTRASATEKELEESIFVHLENRLSQHGYHGTSEAKSMWLSLDVRLNAQGLWFWREHRQ